MLVYRINMNVRLAQKILIIDDDPRFLAAASMSVAELGEVTCRSDSRQLGNLLESVHVIVTDYKMDQGKNGNEIMALAKARGLLSPVILVTAYATKEMAIVSANLHAFAILEKPLNLQELRRVVAEGLSEYWKRAALAGLPTGDATDFLEEIEICDSALTAKSGAMVVKLTEKEFQLLAVFLSNRGNQLTREQVIGKVWGVSKLADNIFDTHLGNLKKKLPAFRHRLTIIRGRGYTYK
jgi:two-component system response regulator TctD